MEISGLALHILAEHWNAELTGGHIQQFRSVGDEQFVLKVRTPEHVHTLLIQLPSVITETQRKWEAEKEQPSFVNATKKEMDNARIASVKQMGLDRILAFETDKGTLIVELFAEGNLVFTNDEGKIHFVHHAREWKGRTLKMNHAYKPPIGPRAWNEWSENVEEMQPDKPGRTLGGWMITQLGIPTAWMDAFCAEIKRNPIEEATISASEWKKIRAHAQKEWKKLKPTFVLEKDKDKTRIVPAHEEENALSLEELFARLEQTAMQEQKEQDVDPKLESEKKALQVNFERQHAQVEAWEKKAKDAQKSGEWIYEHFENVEELLHTLARAKKNKISSALALKEIQKRMPNVKNVDLEKGTVEIETEKE